MSDRTSIVVCVIPAYNEAALIAGVVAEIPDLVAHIVVVDDASTDGTAAVVEGLPDPRLFLIRHPTNRGVGGAVVSGYRKALELGADIVVKIDGDGQMDPAEIRRLVAPLAQGKADYCKGVRFRSAEVLRRMPKVRLVGNLGLSFLTKVASGYWDIFDPTNGFTAIGRHALERLRLSNLHPRSFFESDMLIHLYLIDAVVVDVPTAVRYGDEKSHLKLARIPFSFPFHLLRGTLRRILWRYFIRDFTAFSAFFLAGMALVGFGFTFGVSKWIQASAAGIASPVGTVMLAALPFILGFQLLLQAAVLDIHNVPKEPIQKREFGS